MMNKNTTLKNENGSVIVAAMLILVLLTIIGISATNISNSELNITSNAQLHKMSFFVAESGWHVMTDWLDDQYPLPTQNLASDDWLGRDGINNDDIVEGLVDEHDEWIDFTNAQWQEGFDGDDDNGNGVDDDFDERADFLPFSNGKWDYQYQVTSQYIGAGNAAGWDPTLFLRYNYTITSTGRVPARNGNAVSQITITAGKIQEK